MGEEKAATKFQELENKWTIEENESGKKKSPKTHELAVLGTSGSWGKGQFK